MECLCAIVYQLGKKYLIFIPMVNRVLLKHKIQHDKYEALVKKIYKDPFLPEDEEDRSGFGPSGRGTGSGSGASTVSDETINAPIKKLPVAAATLAKTWKENKRISKDDWQEW